MAGITQTIPNYYGGISEQPDQMKFPGQVKDAINVIPDITYGLYKRPGSTRIGTSKLANVQTGGSWFHYYRDETEGSYIGQVAQDGKVRMWCTKDIYNGSGVKVNSAGDEIFVHYDTVSGSYSATNYSSGNANHTSITSYLTPSTVNSVVQTEDIQALTINDTTYLNNRSKIVSTKFDTTYTRSGTTVTVTRASHGLAVGDNINIDFTSGGATDGDYLVVTVADANTFTVTDASSGTITTSNCTCQPLTAARPDKYFGFINLLRSENGRQYAINLYENENTTNLTTATRLKIINDDLGEGEGTAKCRGIGTQVFSSAETDSGSKKNLTFRLNILGQQGRMNDGHATPTGGAFTCAYNRRITLLHGGEGWSTNDTTPALDATGAITMDQSGGAYSAPGDGEIQWTTPAEYQIKVTESETVATKGYINGGFNGVIRPSPTPFDVDTAVTADAILGGITGELSGTGVTAKVIGTGLYLTSSSAFNVEVVDQDLMEVMQESINDVAKLPIQCKHGYILKVSNSRVSDEDDYYLRFEGNNSQDGPGSWVECAEPGIPKTLTASTLPHVLQRQSINGSDPVIFLLKKNTWKDRDVGDNVTNPIPSFADGSSKINKVIYFRNRLVMLANESVICSRPGTVGTPNFWSDTALTVSAVDPVDIAASSTYPSDLYDALEINTGLLVFSTNQQFLLSADDAIFTPDTAKLRSITTYNYNKVIPPISLGKTIAYIDNSGKYSRFNEVAGIAREGEPIVIEQSKVVPALLEKDIDLLTNSRENGIVMFSKTDTDTVFGFKYFGGIEKRQQSSWFKWKLNRPLLYHFVIDDKYFYLDKDHFLQSINLIQSTTDISINQDDINYLLHLDNSTTIRGGVYSDSTKKTTFTHNTGSCVFNWQSDIGTTPAPNGKLVVIDPDDNVTREGRYAEAGDISAGTSFTLPGNWDYSDEWEIAYTSVNASNEQITLTTGSTDHGLETGDEVRWVQGDTAATGLVNGTTYYVIDASINNIALASSLSNANSGVAVNITAQGTGYHRIQKLTTSLRIGYLYEYSVDFPRFYPLRQEGQAVRANVQGSLVIHRIKLNFGKIGLYETTLTRVGKDDYNEVYESTELDEYEVSDAPYLDEVIKTIPVYEKNTNVSVSLKSNHPAPATLHSVSWEGDYTEKYYRRV